MLRSDGKIWQSQPSRRLPSTAALKLTRIVQSKIFRASEVLRNLLVYLSDKALSGTADTLKEYTIGLDALGKPASFDPRQESVVRMHTARLRQKLAEYYRTEGIDDPVIIDLPKGGFKITFEPRQQAVQPPPAPPLVEMQCCAAQLASA